MNLASLYAAVRMRALHLGLLLAVAVACVAMVGMDAWRTWERRDETLQADRTETANLAHSLAQHAHEIVQSIDTAIVALREVAEMEGVNPRTFGRLEQLMRTQAAALPALHAIVVFDAGGQYVADSLATHHPTLNGSDRAYFRFHAASPDRGVHVGEPFRSRLDQSWVVPVSRRLNAPDGSFAGVVVASVSVDVIQAFYATFDVGRQGSIALLSDNGVLVARKPANDDLVGTSLASNRFFALTRQAGPSGSFQYVSGIDGVARLGSFQRVDGLPLLVVAAHGLDETLVPWRRSAASHLAVSCSIAGCLAVLGLVLSSQVRRRMAVEAALELSERHHRLLAQNSSDMVVQLDTGLRRTYVSPTSATLLGYPPEELAGRPHKDIVFHEDWPALAVSLEQARPGGDIAPVSHRVRKWRGSHLWVETAGRRLPAGAGYILTMRDITRRREAEASLQESNEQLQRLVMVDALTMVGNRQAFDLVLAREYARAERLDTVLSLLIVDIDNFRQFNHRFGPIAGDRCMRLLASALPGCLAHSSDSIARLGDDRFGIVLPDSDAANATGVAEKVGEAARTLNVSASEAMPVGRISVSVGVATVRPRRQATGVQGLARAVEEALCAAKSAGRDRFHLSRLVADHVQAGHPEPETEEHAAAG